MFEQCPSGQACSKSSWQVGRTPNELDTHDILVFGSGTSIVLAFPPFDNKTRLNLTVLFFSLCPLWQTCFLPPLRNKPRQICHKSKQKLNFCKKREMLAKYGDNQFIFNGLRISRLRDTWPIHPRYRGDTRAIQWCSRHLLERAFPRLWVRSPSRSRRHRHSMLRR